MKSVRAFVWLATAIILAAPLGAQQVEIIGGRKAVAHEALVKFRGEANPRLQSAIGRQYAIQEMRVLNRAGVVHMRSASQSAARLIEQLKADPDVLYAEPNYIVNAMDNPAVNPPDDPDFPVQWGLQNNGENGGVTNADIDALAAWTITTGSSNVVVGVVDTGVDYTHPDLKANIWSAPAPYTITFAPGQIVSCPAGSHGFDAILDTCDPMDQENHGTHVSGTIGAVGNNDIGVTGVNWSVTIVGLRFLNATGEGTTANAIRAIEAAIQIKEAFPTQANIQVLSNSWGGPGYSQSLLEEINEASNAGMLFVAAAGNDGEDIGVDPEYPAAYAADNEIAVAATDNTDSLASFSNYSSTLVDLGAPGVNILSTIIGGQYAELSGTSMATPHVSGAAALVLSVCSLSTSALKQTLLSTADPIPALASTTVTGSRLNAYRAVHSCAGQSTSPGITLTATPSVVTLTPGGSAVSVVAVAGNNGFKGGVGMWVAGLPAGVTATFTPAAFRAGGATLLTLTASPSATAINTTVTIWGSGGGSASNSFALVLNVKPSGGFTVTATPPSQTVPQGYSGVIKISVTGNGSLPGGVALQVTGLPPNTSAAYGEAASGSLTLTVATSGLTPIGSYPITVTGISGSLQESASVTLNVIR
jgi:subtilisin family serine protease